MGPASVRGALLALGLALLFASPAGATDFTVNDPGDAGDMTANDEICDSAATAGLQCTLRAAVGEANSDTNPADDTDRIGFAGAIQGTTLSIGSHLNVTQPVTINGCTSVGSTSDAATAPCVGVRTTASPNPNIDIMQATTNDLFVRGLAFTNGQRGIFWGAGQSGLTVENSWFGIKLDGTTAEPDSIGINVTGHNAVIGGTAPRERNVFANIPQIGVEVFSDDDNQILGNYFGTMQDGTTAAPNGTNISVRGNGSTDTPDRTIIGGALSSGELASAACDGPCNVIANATSDGIYLGRDVLSNESAAQSTAIKGNHIGLDKTGNAAAGNGTGVDVAQSDNTTIGGAATTDRNLIGGNESSGVTTENGSTGLLVQNNFLGLNAAGNAALPDDDFEAVLSGGTFSNNRLGGSSTHPSFSGLFLDSGGGSHTVQGNTFGLGTGNENVGLPNAAIDVSASGNLIGSPTPFQNGKGNTIKNTRGAASAGILISTGGSTLRSNFIQSNQGAGIRIENQASGNVIGDDSDVFLSNNISSNTGNAIEIVEDGTDGNLIAQNRGFGNGGLFIDLGKDGTGNAANGPNAGIAAPLVTSATPTTVAGTASPGATVRIYERDSNPGAGLSTFFGTATANGSGNWSFDLTNALNPAPAPGTPLVATQTASSSQNTSELSAEAVVEDVPAPPTFTGTDPASPANNNSPRIKGTAAGGSTVRLYTNASCSGAPVATGSAAAFASPGLQVAVPDNSSTTFHATATGSLTPTSACSSSAITYVENSLTSGGSSSLVGPVLPSAAALTAALKSDLNELNRSLARLGIAGLLRARGVTIQGDALTGGTVRLDGFLTSVKTLGSSASTKFLTGKRTFTGAGKAKVRLKLTKKGRRKLRRARRARLRLRGTFAGLTGKPVTSSRKGSLRRKKKGR